MSNQNTQTTEINRNGKGNAPTHVAKVRHGKGEDATYEQIGVAWENNGAFYIKLNGTQVVSAFSLYKLNGKDAVDE